MRKELKREVERLTREGIAKRMLCYFLSLDFIGRVTKLDRDSIIRLRKEIIAENDVFKKSDDMSVSDRSKFMIDPFMTFFLTDKDCELIDLMEKDYYQIHYPEKIDEVRRLLGEGISVSYINHSTKIPKDVIECIKSEVIYD